MTAFKFEYIWQDGYKPEASLRSKTKILNLDAYDGSVDVLPEWGFDGSSTLQAEGHFSDCLLRPVQVYPDPQRKNAYLVIAEVYNPDGTVHPSNARAALSDEDEYWFGFEQEYVLNDGAKPVGFPEDGYPKPQGPYYCAVGTGNVAAREMVEEHLDACLEAGLGITGINAEVLLGQWEFQCFGKGAKRASDDVICARYLLYRISESYGLTVDLHPKPVKGDWNGSGMHCNFSNEAIRSVGGKALIEAVCEAFGNFIPEHIAVYGSDNEQRLTGLHETQSIHEFSYGVSDRGASIRIPMALPLNDWKGYLEDRRPASNADPYKVAGRVIETLKTVDYASFATSAVLEEAEA